MSISSNKNYITGRAWIAGGNNIVELTEQVPENSTIMLSLHQSDDTYLGTDAARSTIRNVAHNVSMPISASIINGNILNIRCNGGDLYNFCGYNGSTGTAGVYKYTEVTNTMTAKTVTADSNNYYPNMTYINGVFVMNGKYSYAGTSYYSIVHSFDIYADTKQQRKTQTAGMSACFMPAVFSIEGYAYNFSSYDTTFTISRRANRFDQISNTHIFVADAVYAGAGIGGYAIGKFGFISGHSNGSKNGVLHSRYDSVTNCCSIRSSLTNNKGEGCSFSIFGKGIISGNYDASTASTEIYVSHPIKRFTELL